MTKVDNLWKLKNWFCNIVLPNDVSGFMEC